MIAIANKENLFPPFHCFTYFFLLNWIKLLEQGLQICHIDPPNPNPLVVIVKHVVRPPFLPHCNSEKNLRKVPEEQLRPTKTKFLKLSILQSFTPFSLVFVSYCFIGFPFSTFWVKYLVLFSLKIKHFMLWIYLWLSFWPPSLNFSLHCS